MTHNLFKRFKSNFPYGRYGSHIKKTFLWNFVQTVMKCGISLVGSRTQHVPIFLQYLNLILTSVFLSFFIYIFDSASFKFSFFGLEYQCGSNILFVALFVDILIC